MLDLAVYMPAGVNRALQTDVILRSDSSSVRFVGFEVPLAYHDIKPRATWYSR
jgi:hypothetical protein